MKNYILVLAIISVFLISACSQQPEPIQPAPQPKGVIEAADEQSEAQPDALAEQKNEAEEADSVPAKENEPDAVEIEMTAKQWEWNPATITVNEGDTVKLNIKNTDVAHGFAIFEFDVNEKLPPGKTATVEFVADKKGEYTFFCSVPCGSGHRGMKGTLIVK